MKRLFTIIITLLVLVSLSFGITFYTHTKFIDYAFLIGLATTIIIWFFTSKGGFTSQNLDVSVQGNTGFKMEKQKYEFSPNLIFFTSLAYTILTIIALFIYYRNF